MAHNGKIMTSIDRRETALIGNNSKDFLWAHENWTEQIHGFTKTEIDSSIRKQENVIKVAVFLL